MILLIHLAKSSFLLFVFWGIYQLLLRKSKFFQVNRYYLLLTSVLAMVVPFFEFELSYSEPLLPSIYQFREVVVTNAFNVSNDAANPKFSIDFYVYLLFCTILLVYLAGIVKQLGMVRRLKQNANQFKIGNINVVETNLDQAFSVFNYVFISKALSGNNRSQVLIHEIAHCKQLHSFDRFVVGLVLVFQWFNPFAWMLRQAVIENHEFLADEAILQSGANPADYQQLLLNSFFKTDQVQFVTYFNQSLIKKRIIMMTNFSNKRKGRAKVFLAIPLAGFLALCFSFKTTVPKDLISPSLSIEAGNGFEIIVPKSIVQKDSIKKPEQVFIVAEQNASFQGGDLERFRSWILENLKYPANSVQKGIQGKVILSFVVDATGKVGRIKILRSVEKEIDAEAIRVVKSSPDWAPAKQEGKNVAQQFTLPIAFALKK